MNARMPSLMLGLLCGAGALFAQEKHDKLVERRPAAIANTTHAPATNAIRPQPAAHSERPEPEHKAAPRADVTPQNPEPSRLTETHALGAVAQHQPQRMIESHSDQSNQTVRANELIRDRRPVAAPATIQAQPRAIRDSAANERRTFNLNEHFGRSYQTGRGMHYAAAGPAIGSNVRMVPGDYRVERFGDRSYYVSGGVYYQDCFVNGGRSYVVVEPPIGATLDCLPGGFETIYLPGAERLFFANNWFFRPSWRGTELSYVRVAAPVCNFENVYGTVELADMPPLGPDTQVVVRLLDISMPGVAPAIVAEQTLVQPDCASLTYDMQVDRAVLNPNRTYAIDAQVIHSGEIVGRTQFMTLVLNGRPNGAQVLIERCA